MNPNIIKREAIIIAGVSSNGDKTWDAWNMLEKLNHEKPLFNKISDNGYEIRLYEGDACTVYVGFAVSDEHVDPAYKLFKLPNSQYASFDVYVANGYDSENDAMNGLKQTIRDILKGYWDRLIIAWSIMMNGLMEVKQAPSLRFGFQ